MAGCLHPAGGVAAPLRRTRRSGVAGQVSVPRDFWHQGPHADRRRPGAMPWRAPEATSEVESRAGQRSRGERRSASAAPPHTRRDASPVPVGTRHLDISHVGGSCEAAVWARQCRGAVRGSWFVSCHVFSHLWEAGCVHSFTSSAEARQCGPGGDAGEAERGTCGVDRARLPRHPGVRGASPPGWRRRTPSEVPG